MSQELKGIRCVSHVAWPSNTSESKKKKKNLHKYSPLSSSSPGLCGLLSGAFSKAGLQARNQRCRLGQRELI